MERELRDALECDHQLWVSYQPIHEAGGGVAAVEALARWSHPAQGNVPPADFIAIAEDSGLIVALGEHILREACEQVSHWGDLSVSVNVSARQVTAPGLVETVSRTLAYLRRFPLEMLKIDRSFIDDEPIVAAIVGMARALGMRTVPEGVETAEQLERVLGLDCDYVQGYHLGRPMAARELEAQLASPR